MSPMTNCNEAAPLIAPHGDGELDPAQAIALEKHLLGCAACAARAASAGALRAQIRRDAPYHTAPGSLRARVIAALPPLPSAAPAPRRDARWRWLSAGALGGALATVLVWVVGTAVLSASVEDRFETELVSNHVRATLAHRLTDVASSDQHTVKPWLSARLDYSPQVQDLGTEGFPLIGGRLDYLDKQAVATLVYRYRDHVIDVFVRPQSRAGGLAGTTVPRTIRGFHVAHASGGAMDWWAVSDVSPDVLSSFVARLADTGSR